MNDEVSNAFDERSGIDLEKMFESTDYEGEVKKAVNLTRFKREREKAMKNITASSRTERWRAGVAWLLKHNKEARIEHNEVVKWVAEIKQDNLNKFGSSEKQTFRHGLKLPGLVLDTLYIVDPQLSHDLTNGTAAEQKRVYHELMRAFPEYRTAEVI